MTKRYSIEVLEDCIKLQERKGDDYQNKASSIKQADYYRLGLDTIYDIMWAKMLRIKSQLEAARNNPNHSANFESIGDSAKDLINYCSFFVSYADGKMDGQNLNHDVFNRPNPKSNEMVIDNAKATSEYKEIAEEFRVRRPSKPKFDDQFGWDT